MRSLRRAALRRSLTQSRSPVGAGARVLTPATPAVRLGRQQILFASIGILCRPAVQRRGPRPAPPARPHTVAIEPGCEGGGVTPYEGLAAARSAGRTAGSRASTGPDRREYGREVDGGRTRPPVSTRETGNNVRRTNS